MGGKTIKGEDRSAGVVISGTVESVDGDIVGRDKIVIQTGGTRPVEKDVVYKLMAFLEDRRLLSEEFGYQSHFPDHLRMSAQEIRRRTNEAIQSLDPTSAVRPILKRLQDAARKFQTATEGAMDGARAHGGMTPMLPMGLSKYLESLLGFRKGIAAAIIEAAEMHGLVVDSCIRQAASDNARELSLIESLKRSGR